MNTGNSIRRTLSCPKCYHRVALPTGPVTGDGLKMQCPQCATSFTVRPKSKATQPAEEKATEFPASEEAGKVDLAVNSEEKTIRADPVSNAEGKTIKTDPVPRSEGQAVKAGPVPKAEGQTVKAGPVANTEAKAVKTDPVAKTEFSVDGFVDDIRTRLIGSFLENFKRFEPDVRAKPEVFERFGRELLDAMFINWPEIGDEEKIRFLFERLVKKTKLAEQILGRTWLEMLSDFSQDALTHELPMEDVFDLLEQIQRYHSILHDIYFEVIRNPGFQIPDIDRSAEDYQRLLVGFRRYKSEVKPGSIPSVLKIINYYRGIPVEFDANLVKVTDDSVYCQVPHFQADILENAGLALIDSPIHGAVYRGYVDEVDLNRNIVCFSHIVPYGEEVERREDIRIEPDGALMARFKFPGGEVEGRILDLSLRACAVYLRNVEIGNLNKGLDVRVNFELPETIGKLPVTVDVDGTVVRISSSSFGGRNEHRVVVSFSGGYALENKLSPYIVQRQSQILKELKEERDA